MEPAVTSRNLFHAYGDGMRRKTILHDVNIEVRPGELTLITGPSGSGKTTLLTLIGALRAVQEGSLRVAGEELSGATSEVQTRVRRRVGYVFQSSNLLPFLTARENVLMSLNLLPVPLPKEEGRSRAAEALAAVGLADHVDDYPATLSGGEKQRVAIARALAHHPRLVLADEPTAALDKQNGHECVKLMREVARAQGCPILIVTHDPRIQDIADRILRIDDGHIQEES
jgi:putative ABC transport system ATP-binding protein